MAWTAADFALILTTLGTLWGVVYPALTVRSERRRARLESIASEFHAALAGCIETCIYAMEEARHAKLAMAAFRANTNPIELSPEVKLGSEAFAKHLLRLKVLGHRYGIDVTQALAIAADLRIYKQDFDFVDGVLVKTSETDEPRQSVIRQGELLKAIGEIYLAVDRWVERGKRG